MPDTDASFQALATRSTLQMSDNSAIQVYRLPATGTMRTGLVVLFIGGWGTVVEGWDFATLEFAKDFDVVYIETREKNSSRLSGGSTNDLRRLAADLYEVVEQLGIDQQRLVIFGSSWGGVVAAQCLAEKRLDPLLAVFAAPISKLGLPPLTRYLVPIAPPGLLDIVKPALRFWLVRMRSKTPEQAAVYLRILEGADPRKWKTVGRHAIFLKFSPLYEQVTCPALVIAIELADKFHTSTEARHIANSIPDCGYVSVRWVEEMDSPRIVEFVRQYLSRPQFASVRVGAET